MELKFKKDFGVVSTDVRDINNREMRQMHELKLRVKAVLDSHKDGSEKKEYISDDDLKLMHAILNVFTKEYSDTQTSAFDDELKKMEKEVKPQPLPLPEDADLFGGGDEDE